MPNLGKGTESIKILLSQASKDMHEPLIPMLFPILGAHVSGAEFQYPDLTWKELCSQMANLVAESGGNKGKSAPTSISSQREGEPTHSEFFSISWCALPFGRGWGREERSRSSKYFLSQDKSIFFSAQKITS